MDALNWLAGYRERPSPLQPGFAADPLQDEVIARLDSLHAARVPGPDAPSPEEALRGLLHDRGIYEEMSTGVNLAAFCDERVSLPESIHGCPLVDTILPDPARYYLEAYQERMLRDARRRREEDSLSLSLRALTI